MSNNDCCDTFTGNRRYILKLISAFASVSGGLSVIPGAVAAGGDGRTGYSGPDIGKDQVIATAPAGGGCTDEEWETSRDEQDAQVYFDLLPYPNPGELPLDFCFQMDNGNELCVKTATQFQRGKRSCYEGETPVLDSITLTLKEWENGSLRAKLQMWIGIDDYDCLWVGQEDSGLCAGNLACRMTEKFEAMIYDPTTWIDAIQPVAAWVDDNEDDIIDGAIYFTELAIKIIVLIAVIIVVGILGAAGVGSGA